MFRLRKLLADSSKAQRHRRKILNVQITFLAWLVESVGFLVIFLGMFILGHESNTFNFFMQSLTLVIYFIVLPTVFLINDSDVKSSIVASNWYDRILTIFHCNYVKPNDNDTENSSIHNASVENDENRPRENHTNAAADSCEQGNKHSPLFKRTFKEPKKEDSTGNRNENERNIGDMVKSTTLSYSNDVIVSDLE